MILIKTKFGILKSWTGQPDITDAVSAIVGQELVPSCRFVSRDTVTVVAAHCVGTLAPGPTDISHVLALVIICGEEMEIQTLKWAQNLSSSISKVDSACYSVTHGVGKPAG